MLIEERNSLDISSGAAETRGFGIKADAEMMFTLISGIAKDKIGYVVREVSSNAQDYSPSDKPFELHLPSVLNPTIRWRDFGPSMDHEFVMQRTTTIGDSGSRSFGNKLGGFGLGSKSPFGYLIASSEDGGGAFNMRCFQKGRVRTYLMVIAKNGMPECRYFGEAPTNDEDGTEISFAVKREDINAFRQAARTTLLTFEPRPRLFPEPENWETLDQLTIERGDRWRLLPVYSGEIASGPMVRMGSVFYHIDFAYMGRYQAWPWKNSSVMFEAPIGSLRPIRSREALEYTDATRDQLFELIEEFEADVVQKTNDTLAKEPTFLLACAKALELADNVPGLKTLPLCWRGKPIVYAFEGRTDEYSLCFVNEAARYGGFSAWGREGRDCRKKWRVQADGLATVKSIVIHTPKGMRERLLEANLESPILVVKNLDAKSIRDKFGFEPVDLAKIKLPKISRTEGGGLRLRRVQYLSGDGTKNNEMIDIEAGGLFVVIDRKPRCRARRVFTGKSEATFYINNVVSALSSLKFEKRVYAFEPNTLPPPDRGWVYLADYVRANILPSIDMKLAGTAVEFGSLHTSEVILVQSLGQTIVPPDVRAHYDWCLEKQTARGAPPDVVEHDQRRRLVSQILGPIPDVEQKKSLNDQYRERRAELDKKYPVLKVLTEQVRSYERTLSSDLNPAFAEYFRLLQQGSHDPV